MRVIPICAVLMSVLGMAGPSRATTFVVDATVDDVDVLTGDGLCATAGGDCTLRAAVQEADALPGTDTITIPAGTYVLTIPRGPFDESIPGQGDLDVLDDLIVNGAGADVTVIDANDVDRAFHVFPGVSLAASDLTVRNGNGLFGGGIANSGDTLTLTNVVVTECQSFASGLAGGLYNAGTLVVTGGALTNNSAAEGGAIFMNDGSATLVDTTIAGNHSDRDGGAIKYHAPASSMTLTGCTVSGNTADEHAGAILVSESILTMINSTVSGNQAEGPGGGIYVNGSATLSNVTITGNVTDGGGGGLYVTGFPGDLVVRNSIVAGNLGAADPDCRGTLSSAGHNLIETPCTITGDVTGNVIGVSAGLAPLADNGGPTATHMLLPGSPASSAGNPGVPGSGGNTCEATDQRGVARPQGSRCDIGSVEPSPACADGSVDPGEACDDRNLVAGDCCDATCQAEPAGNSCPDDGSDCTGDVCGGGGVCTHPSVAAGTPCAADASECTGDACDGAGTCAHPPVTAGTPCSADASVCTDDVCDGAGACAHAPALNLVCASALAGSSRIALKVAARSALRWTMKGADAVTTSDFGAPLATTGFTLCVIDDVSGTPRLAVDTSIPSGTACQGCWVTRSNGFRFRSADRSLVTKLRAGAPGRSRFQVGAKAPTLAVPPLPLVTPVRVRLHRNDAPTCWESVFSTASRSDTGRFKAKGD